MDLIGKLIYRDDTPLVRGDSKTSWLLEPYEYLQKLPGNNSAIRVHFIQAFNDLFFGIDNSKLILAMNDVVNILHDSLLMIDDVEDLLDVRRGSPAAHIKYGVPSTVNCVNYMYFVAIQKAQELAQIYTEDKDEQEIISAKINSTIVGEMLNLHHGQGIDIYWRDNKNSLASLPSEQEYLEMVMDKTGGLLRLMVKLLDAFSPAKSKNHVALSSLMGIVYQLRDDYFNLTSDKYSHMKGIVGEDLLEGKFSFPILHSLSYSTDSPVHKLLYTMTVEDRKNNPELVKQAIEYMANESKSLEYTNKKIKDCLQTCREMVEQESMEKKLILQILQQLNDT